jgi:hypothetical protein
MVTALLTMPLLVLLLLSACSYPLYPSTAGSHAPPSKGDLGARYVVWSNHFGGIRCPARPSQTPQ